VKCSFAASQSVQGKCLSFHSESHKADIFQSILQAGDASIVISDSTVVYIAAQKLHFLILLNVLFKVKVKFSCYRPKWDLGDPVG
jgi:hypothetical protein